MSEHNDDCLHCQLMVAIKEHFELHDDIDDGDREVIEALAQVFADLASVADAKGRNAMRAHLNAYIRLQLAIHDKDGTLRAGYLVPQN